MRLSDNAFYILNTSLDDNRKTIVERAEELSLRGNADKVSDARAILTNPQRRIAAEVHWFVGCSKELCEEILESIEDDHQAAFSEPISDLAQLNMRLYCIDSIDFSNKVRAKNYVLGIARLFNSLSLSDILAAINSHRNNAGFPTVSREAEIEPAITELRNEIKHQLSQKLKSTSEDQYVEVVTRLAESYSENEKYKGNAIIEDIISEYQLFISGTIERKADELRSCIKSFETIVEFFHTVTGKGNNLTPAALDPLKESVDTNQKSVIDALYEWDRFAQPLQLCAMTRGSIDEESEEILNEFRRLSISLHNNYQMTERSLALTNAMQTVFKELPTYTDLLDEDADTLERISAKSYQEEQYLDELEDIKASFEELVETDGFPGEKVLNDICLRMEQLLQKMQADAKIDDELFEDIGGMFRSFAIRLNNDKKDPSSALFVTKRLQSVSGFSSSFYSQLLEDERKLLELVDEEKLFLDLSPHLDKLKTLSKEAKNCTGSALEEKLNQYIGVINTAKSILGAKTCKFANTARTFIKNNAIDLFVRLSEDNEFSGALKISGYLLTSFGGLSAKDTVELNQAVSIIQTKARAEKERKDNQKIKRVLAATFGGIILIVAIAAAISNSTSSSTRTSYTPAATSKPVVTAQPAATTPKPTVTPTATPKPTPSYSPVSVYNGKIFISPDYEGVCPLEIKAGSGSNYYIYLEYQYAPSYSYVNRTSTKSYPTQSDLSFYVASGKTIEVDVPIGVYKLYYAAGDTFYGTKHLFGDDTSCYTSSELLTFRATTEYFEGHTLTLYKVAGGNYSTSSISESSFPTT